MAKEQGASRMVRSRNEGLGVRTENSRIKHRRFVPTGRQLCLVLLMLTVFMGGGIGYVWSNFEKTRIGYDLSKLRKEEKKLREMNKKLRLELAFLKSPATLERRARKELGLRRPDRDQVVVLP